MCETSGIVKKNITGLSILTTTKYYMVASGFLVSHFQISSCLEFKKPSQTTAEQGEAELCILDFKTTRSEF